MKTADIIALQPGPQLDAAVHQIIFHDLGAPPAYSTDMAEAVKILDRQPLFVARTDPGQKGYNPERPYLAGTLANRTDGAGEVTTLRVTAAEGPVALCKAALIYATTRPGGGGNVQLAAAAPVSIAAKIGRRSSPSSKNMGPQPARGVPPIMQPKARVHAREERKPFPKRPKNFVGPEPIDTGGQK